MSSVISATIDGIGTIPVHAEYTDEAVLIEYGQALSLLVGVFNKNTVFDAETNPTPDTITAQDFEDVSTGLGQLLDLANNGRVINTRQFFVTVEMARSINLISRSLFAVGFDPSETNATAQIDMVKRWRDLSDIGLVNVMRSSVNVLTANRSLQALIELEYVRTGNEQIFAALSQLEEATVATRDALNLLERVQRLHNLLTPEENPIERGILIQAAGKIEQSADLTSVGGAVQTLVEPIISGGIYSAKDILSKWDGANIPHTAGEGRNLCTVESVVAVFRSSFDPIFSDPIFPNIDQDPTAVGAQTLSQESLNEYLKLREQLKQTIVRLDTINGTFAGGPNEANRAGTLAEQLENVLDDMALGAGNTAGAPPANRTQTGTGIYAWILDGYRSRDTGQAGNFQRRITDGITTAESVNDQQRQELRRELFVFEEFYRSSSAILTTINRIIERMASNIAR